jgi:hypothetical protein
MGVDLEKLDGGRVIEAEDLKRACCLNFISRTYSAGGAIAVLPIIVNFVSETLRIEPNWTCTRSMGILIGYPARIPTTISPSVAFRV